VLLDDLLDLALELGCDVTGGNLLEESILGGCEVATELSLPLGDLVDGDRVQETVDTGVDDGDLDLHGEGLVLTLLEELSQTGTTGEEEAGRGIEIRTELGEGGDFTVLSEVQLKRTGKLLHDLTVRNPVNFRTPEHEQKSLTSGQQSRHETRRDRR